MALKDGSDETGGQRWRMYAQMDSTTEYHIPGRPPVAIGKLSLVSPEGQIYDFDFTSGGVSYEGRGRAMLPGLADDRDMSGNGRQATYQLHFGAGGGESAARNYQVDSRSVYPHFRDQDGDGSQLRLHGDPSEMRGRNGFLIHTRGKLGGAYDVKGTAGCIGLDTENSDAFFGMLEEIRMTNPGALPTELVVLGKDDPGVAQQMLASARTGERIPQEETRQPPAAPVESEIVIAPPPSRQQASPAPARADTDDGFSQRLNDASGRSEIRGIQRELADQGLYDSKQIDGVTGAMSRHGAALADDTDGSYARQHLADFLATGNISDGNGWRMAQASINRLNELEGRDTILVDGKPGPQTFGEVMEFAEHHRGVEFSQQIAGQLDRRFGERYANLGNTQQDIAAIDEGITEQTPAQTLIADATQGLTSLRDAFMRSLETAADPAQTPAAMETKLNIRAEQTSIARFDR